MGDWWTQLVTDHAWALWLAVPGLGIVAVCVGVWWVARPARPASTSRSIAGHHAYLDALVREPRERVEAPPAPEPLDDSGVLHLPR